MNINSIPTKINQIYSFSIIFQLHITRIKASWEGWEKLVFWKSLNRDYLKSKPFRKEWPEKVEWLTWSSALCSSSDAHSRTRTAPAKHIRRSPIAFRPYCLIVDVSRASMTPPTTLGLILDDLTWIVTVPAVIIKQCVKLRVNSVDFVLRTLEIFLSLVNV